MNGEQTLEEDTKWRALVKTNPAAVAASALWTECLGALVTELSRHHGRISCPACARPLLVGMLVSSHRTGTVMAGWGLRCGCGRSLVISNE
jgi:hypothetical protein